VPDPTSLFEPAGDGTWLPTAWSRGPWSPDALHGGPVAALLAGELERAGGTDVEWQPARLSVELLRPVPVTPLRVDTRVTRPGRKVQLLDASVTTADGTEVATGRLLRIRDADVPAPVTTTDERLPKAPDSLPSAVPGVVESYEGFHNRGVEHRFASGMFGVPGPATDWIRLRVPVAPEVEPTPLQRVAGAADFGNGISSVADFSELIFINPDLTIHLHRQPAGEWVCLEAVTWMEARGLALAESRLWDERGPLGRSQQSLLVERRPA
jgi:hypothetical protein